MALDVGALYPLGVDPDDADYPFGKPRNITVTGDGLGFPLELAWVRDIYGFLHGLLVKAGNDPPSGTADNVNDSQYRDALEIILAQRAEFDHAPLLDVPAVGSVLSKVGGNILPQDYLSRYGAKWGSGTTISCKKGSCRSQGDDADLIASSDITKTFNVTWAVGVAGGMAAGAFPLSAGWFGRFVIMKPDGTTDFIFDTIDGGNIFGDPAVVSAGYSSSELVRLIGYAFWDGAALPEFTNQLEALRRYRWSVPFLDIDIVDLGDGPRTALTLAHVPPQQYGTLGISANGTTGSYHILITEADQADSVASDSRWSMHGEEGTNHSIRGEWRVNAASNIFGRRGSGDLTNEFQIMVDGWRDEFPAQE